MIKNYGVLWQRKYLHIGNSASKGSLLGKAPSVKQVDFRDQIGIYILYDKDFKPIYVGQAGNGNAKLFDRLKVHTRDHIWNRWEYFSWFGLRGVNRNGSLSGKDTIEKNFHSNGPTLLNEIEGMLLVSLEPPHNKQGPKFRGVKKYSQAVDEDIVEYSVENVHDQIEELSKEIKDIKKQVVKVDKKVSQKKINKKVPTRHHGSGAKKRK